MAVRIARARDSITGNCEFICKVESVRVINVISPEIHMPACLLLEEVATGCNFRTLLCVQAAKVPSVRGQISLLIFQSA